MLSPLSPRLRRNSCSVSEPDDFMDTDSSTSQGQVTSINGIHPPQRLDDLPEKAEAIQSAVHDWSNDQSPRSLENNDFSRKRKRSSQIGSPNGTSQVARFPGLEQPCDLQNEPQATEKRQRTDTSNLRQTQVPLNAVFQSHPEDRLYGLDPILWQRVFCFVPPVFLGRLLRVCRTFHSLLTESSDHGPIQEQNASGSPRLMLSRSIWTASRQRFAPGLPKPLRNRDELDMWRLLRGSDCQICGQKRTLITTGNNLDPWHSGPGANGVRVIWPFGIRSCGPCLVGQCEQEISLLCSNIFPSFLLQALPCILLTQYHECVYPSNIENGLQPVDIRITKFYFKSHLREIERRFKEVKDLGSGPVEEWIKGLDGEKRDSVQDAMRWEQWEAKGGLKKVNLRPSSRLAASQRNVTATTAVPVTNQQSFYGSQFATTSSVDLPTPTYEPRMQFSPNATSPMNNASSGFGANDTTQGPPNQALNIRPERSIRDVNEARAIRRADIEKRCQALDPPILPNTLIHMESFQAALQISTPLTERAWEILKPRLLAQRKSAEAREATITENARTARQTLGEHDFYGKDAVDASDREWELAQAPIRERLAANADAIIAKKWAAGAIISKENAPAFAADVLLSARAKFNDENTRESQNLDHPELQQLRLARQKITLETMKWLYDHKIKAIAEHFQKELFLCNGCEANSKQYGFEAVIQHYAAKHTSSLSLGNVVVNWRADWPDESPFHLSPKSSNAVSMPPNANSKDDFKTSLHQSFRSPADIPYGENNFIPHATESTSPVGVLALYPTTSPPFPPSQQTLNEQHPPGNEQYPYQFNQPSSGYSHQYASPFVTVVDQRLAYQTSAAVPTCSAPGIVPNGTSSHITVPNENLASFAQNSYPPSFGATDLYHTQLNEMAKHARDVWFGTSGIKDIPQSVRIYVVIQHVVFRFEQKYTNEPSLSMFIDGLDHNAQMRPVRSLNGLACRTCSASPNAVTGDSAQPPAASSDRKLFTLPLLLNHFRAVHVERAQPTIDSQSGIESSRLDWKRDMIELPEPAIIQKLMNAPGIDDKKLHLIAWVFPGLFPDPFPKFSLGSRSSSTQKFQHQQQNPFDQSKALAEGRSSSNVAVSQTAQPPGEQRLLARQVGQYPSPSPQISDPPGDDEYDPHRPAYLGRIVESHPLQHSSLPRSPQGYSGSGANRPGDTEYGRSLPEESRKYRGEGAYGDQLLRHHDKAVRHAAFRSDSPPRNPLPQDVSRSMGQEIFDGPSAFSQREDNQSRRSDIVAADRFLHDLDTATELRKYGPNADQDAAPISADAVVFHHLSERSANTAYKGTDRMTPLSEHESGGLHRFQDPITRKKADGNLTGLGTESRKGGYHPQDHRTVQYVYSPDVSIQHRGPSEVHGETNPRYIEYLTDARAPFIQPPIESDVERGHVSSRAYRPESPAIRAIRYSPGYYESPRAEARGAQMDIYRENPHAQPNRRGEYDLGRVEYVYSSPSDPNLSYSGNKHRRVEYLPMESDKTDAGSPVFMSTRAFNSHMPLERTAQRASLYGPDPQRIYYVDSQPVGAAESPVYNHRRSYEYAVDRDTYHQ